MRIHQTSLKGVLIVEPQVFRDKRGYFLETYHEKKFKEAGIDSRFVQTNHSHSIEGVIRGLHYQLKYPQAKLIYVPRGSIFDVAVDIRQDSPTFAKWIGFHISEENHNQVFIPCGFAHGFCVMSKEADVIYKCTGVYEPDDEYGIRWDDPKLSIYWPVKDPTISEKDLRFPYLSNIQKEALPCLKK